MPRDVDEHGVVHPRPDGVGFMRALDSLDQVGITFDSGSSLKFSPVHRDESYPLGLANAAAGTNIMRPRMMERQPTPLRNASLAAGRPTSLPLPSKKRRFSLIEKMRRFSWFGGNGKSAADAVAKDSEDLIRRASAAAGTEFGIGIDKKDTTQRHSGLRISRASWFSARSRTRRESSQSAAAGRWWKRGKRTSEMPAVSEMNKVG